MIQELLRTSCAAPEGHTHHEGQRSSEGETQRGEQSDGVTEGKAVGPEGRPQPLLENDGGGVGRWESVVEWEQGRTGSAGWKDGRRTQRLKRGSEEDRRRERQNGWRGGGKEAKGQGKKGRNVVGDGVRGIWRKEERAGREEIRGMEVG